MQSRNVCRLKGGWLLKAPRPIDTARQSRAETAFAPEILGLGKTGGWGRSLTKDLEKKKVALRKYKRGADL